VVGKYLAAHVVSALAIVRWYLFIIDLIHDGEAIIVGVRVLQSAIRESVLSIFGAARVSRHRRANFIID